jgi:hypothetical protein
MLQHRFQKKIQLQYRRKHGNDGIQNKTENIISGFRGSGIWPPSFPRMQERMRLYQNGGIQSRKVTVEAWIKCREEVRTQVLCLPPQIERSRKRRKTLDGNNRLLTREQLNSYKN